MKKVAICGAMGRMGKTIAALVDEDPALEFIGGINTREGTLSGRRVLSPEKIDDFLAEEKPDVLIDFTIAGAAVRNIQAASGAGIAVVVGTTGFSEEQKEEIRRNVDGRIPAVISANFSVGVNIFRKLVREAAKQLSDYDIEVTEAHHHFKKDAPGGTAKSILEIIKEEAGDREEMYGREGMVGKRGKEIGVHVIRGGDIVGDHSVMFAGNNEVIELSHRAYDRAVPAHGVIMSAKWIADKKPGIYTMDDVLGLTR